MTACPVCAASAAELLDRRRCIPVAQNVMFRSREAALECATGALEMVRCMACGFAWNAAFDPGLLTYDEDYENDQTLSPAYCRHLDAVADLVAARMVGRSDIKALEIGIGQGQFLGRLAGRLGDRLERLVGFDPAFRPSSPLPDCARVERLLFSDATRGAVGEPPDLVVSRHVIEHVADPIAFLSAIRGVCDAGTPLVVETPNLDWILAGAVVQDLYYEHCSLFDAPSLARALAATGFQAEEIRESFGGQYLVAVARAVPTAAAAPEPAAPIDNRGYAARKAGVIDALAASLARDAAAGERVAFWGGASKGVTLALLLDGRAAGAELAIDVNPARAGTFMPVTGLPVVLPETAQAAGITKAYVMNPLYHDEIARDAQARGWPLRLAVLDAAP